MKWACFAAQQAAEKAVIPTRHANSHAEGPPFEHFGVLRSDEALRGRCAHMFEVQARAYRTG